MLFMIFKMTSVTGLYVLLTVLLWNYNRKRTLTLYHKLLIGLIYGGCAVLSTHFGIDYNHMMLNVRDLGPLSAGLFFDPVSGIIAGLIARGLLEGGFAEQNILVTGSLQEAAEKLRTEAKPGDVILFENDLPDSYSEE